MIGSVLAAAVRYRILLLGVACGLIALGIVSLRQMPVDVLPELASAPVLEVQTEAPGLSSTEVEQYVTVPMENNLLDGIMGVWDVRSQSVPGLAAVDLYFEPGTTELNARQLVEERLTNSFSLPNVAKPPLLIQPLSSSDRTLLIGLSSRTVDPLELSYLARWVVKPRLSGVPGVANVAIFGQKDRQIQVQVHPSVLARQGISLQQVINTAGNAQLVSPLSYLEGSAPGTGGFLDGPNQRLEVRPVLPLSAPADLAAVPIAGAAHKTTLGKVASVVEDHQPLIGAALTAQGPGLVLEVQRLPSASVRGVTDGVERALAQLRPALKSVSVDDRFFRPASYIAQARHNMLLALVIAGALGALALLLVLLDIRSVAIAAASIALSLLAAAVVLDLLGDTLNALVVLGLLLASAVVVDDAVGATRQVMTAAIAARAEGGPSVSVRSAILSSYAELRATLCYATAIVLIAIAPLFFAKGLTATYLHPMVLAFGLGVVVSLVIAFTITPALGVIVFARGARRRNRGPAEALGDLIEWLLARFLTLPRLALVPVCALGLAGFVVFPFLHEPAPPTFQDRNLVIDWHGPTGISLPEMDRITDRTLTALRALPAVADVGATLGRAVSADQIVGTGTGELYVALKGQANYARAVDAVRAIVDSVPGMQASLSTYEGTVQAGVLAPPDPAVRVRVYGEDYGELASLADQVRTGMGHVYGLGPGTVLLGEQEPGIQVAINDAAAHSAGVLPGDARRQASTLVSGLTVGNFFEDQAVFDVVVLGDTASRATLGAVRALPIDTDGGHTVSLGRIASVTVQPNPIDIDHEALSRYIDITAPVYSNTTASATTAIRHQLQRIAFPLGYHAEIVGGTPEDPTSQIKFLTFAIAAAIGALLILQAALESWLMALLLLITLPAALSGGLAVALLTGQERALAADAGLLAIFALAARQALLQAAGIRRLAAVNNGGLTTDLILSATRERRSASLAGSLTLAAVLAPFLAVGTRAGTEITHTTAAVVLGGLLSATCVSELIVPAICHHVLPARARGTAPSPETPSEPSTHPVLSS